MSETRWAIRTNYPGGTGWVEKGVRPMTTRREFTDRWEACAFMRDLRRRWPRATYELIRIKPRLSPEAKAARDALCAAAVAQVGRITGSNERNAFIAAGDAYEKAVRPGVTR